MADPNGVKSAKHTFAGVLLDFDGTIIDSTEAIVENWKRVAIELDIDHKTIIETSHGMRSIDVLKMLDPSKANWEYVGIMDRRIPYLCEKPPTEIPGARSLLESLSRDRVPYAIVTSGSKALLQGWLERLQLPAPGNVIVAEDVKIGKPDPEGYLRAKGRLLLEHATNWKTSGNSEADLDVLVIEDAPAGVKAGKAAGCKVLAVVTTHTISQLRDAGADWIIQDLSFLQVETAGHGWYFVFNHLL